MHSFDAELLQDARCALGEGPQWAHNELAYVDIESNRAFVGGLAGVRTSREFAGRIGAILPSECGWVVAVEGVGLIALDRDLQGDTVIAHPEPNRPENRYNDGAIDPAGRLWIGTMHLACNQPTAALYRVDTGGRIEKALNDLTISNGIAWSPDARTMYYIDTPTRRVDAHAFDPETGAIKDRRTFTTIEGGYPDGMCVDNEGGVWVARWAGGRVTRFDPSTGEPTHEVRVPCAHATACCFAGDGLGTLVITTARGENDTPRAGAVFGARTGHAGIEPSLFRG